MPVLRKGSVPPISSGGGYPPPFDEGLGEYKAWPLSDAGGLTQFGAFTEELAPGAYSSLRHWHENEDEFVYVLTGEVTLIDDSGPQVLRPGDAATFKAGEPNGHRLHNATAAPVTYLVVGTRAATDRCHYPDLDLLYTRDAQARRFTRRDGTLLKETRRS
jgi:uncharacterized cupin superfamily protein